MVILDLRLSTYTFIINVEKMAIFPSMVFGLLFVFGTSGKSIELEKNELPSQFRSEFRSVDSGINSKSNEIPNEAVLLNEKQNHVGNFLPKTTYGNHIF